MLKLGQQTKDKVTGLRGIVGAIANCLTGGPKIFLIPMGAFITFKGEGIWLDIARVDPDVKMDAEIEKITDKNESEKQE